ncbi:hypothetical protein ACTXT7_014291, partial [Hymenolepis weldensis]
YWTTPHTGCSNLGAPSQKSPFSVRSIDFQTENRLKKIYLDACYLSPPLNSKTPEIQLNRWTNRYCGCFKTSRKRFWGDPKLKHVDKEPSP